MARPTECPVPAREPLPPLSFDDAGTRPRLGVVGMVVRGFTLALVVLAVSYVIAVGAWLWSLRHQIGAPDVSTGLLLVGAAMVLARLAGVAEAVPHRAGIPAVAPWHGPGAIGAGVYHLTRHPLGILRFGLLVQLGGFLALVALL